MVITKNYEFMGIWQHQAAEAFHNPIGSVFPYPANLNLHVDLNRIILSLNSTFDTKLPVHMQWSPLCTDRHASDVKHFACLMKPPTVSIFSPKYLCSV